jgi:hypothetical protein
VLRIASLCESRAVVQLCKWALFHASERSGEAEYASAVEGPGELRVKGPNVFSCYINKPDATAAAFDEEGWFRSAVCISPLSCRIEHFTRQKASMLNLEWKQHVVRTKNTKSQGHIADGLSEAMPWRMVG